MKRANTQIILPTGRTGVRQTADRQINYLAKQAAKWSDLRARNLHNQWFSWDWLSKQRWWLDGRWADSTVRSRCTETYKVQTCPHRTHRKAGYIALFTPGVNLRLGRSDHKWTVERHCCSNLSRVPFAHTFTKTTTTSWIEIIFFLFCPCCWNIRKPEHLHYRRYVVKCIPEYLSKWFEQLHYNMSLLAINTRKTQRLPWDSDILFQTCIMLVVVVKW